MMDSKKILLINYEYPPVGGGGGVASAVLAKGFLERGYTVDCVTSGFQDTPTQETVNGVRVYRVPAIGRRSRQAANVLSMLSFIWCGWWQARRLCKKNRYLFINTHFALPSGPVGWMLQRQFQLPNILSIHGGDIYDPSKRLSPHRWRILRWVVRQLLRTATAVVAQSSDVQTRAKQLYTATTSIALIPLAYDNEFHSPRTRADLGLEAATYYFICAGRLVRRKNITSLVQALTQLPSSVELLVIGDGPELPALQAQARQSSVTDRIHWLGHISEADKFAYLQASNAFILPSFHEGFGIVFQEAMQAQLPIIASTIGGQTDFLQHEYNALLVDPHDPSAIIRAMQRLIEDPLLCQALTKHHAATLAQFAPQHIAQQYIQLLSSSL